VDTGIQCSLRQLLEFGYFHADPHPGNLLATPDGRLAFLDFGMMSETPEYVGLHTNLLPLDTALTAAQILVALS
jgi:predicted unusual protein kinase regulating ubiquinone biosynthesis (AarF/ABC1/UbiB family)